MKGNKNTLLQEKLSCIMKKAWMIENRCRNFRKDEE